MQKVPAILKPRHSKTEKDSEDDTGSIKMKQEKLCALVLFKKPQRKERNHELQHSIDS